MTIDLNARNLPLLTDITELPPYVVNGEGDYGLIERAAILRAEHLANEAYKRLGQVDTAPDDIASLRQAINYLSDALNVVVGVLAQVHVGISTGRIVAVEGE